MPQGTPEPAESPPTAPSPDPSPPLPPLACPHLVASFLPLLPTASVPCSRLSARAPQNACPESQALDAAVRRRGPWEAMRTWGRCPRQWDEGPEKDTPERPLLPPSAVSSGGTGKSQPSRNRTPNVPALPASRPVRKKRHGSLDALGQAFPRPVCLIPILRLQAFSSSFLSFSMLLLLPIHMLP